MTPQEKARELLNSYTRIIYNYYGIANPYEEDVRHCALVAVEEILKCQKRGLDIFPGDGYSPSYWEQVKDEIEKLDTDVNETDQRLFDQVIAEDPTQYAIKEAQQNLYIPKSLSEVKDAPRDADLNG